MRRLRVATDSDFASLIPPSCRWAPPAIKRGCLGPHSVTATPPAGSTGAEGERAALVRLVERALKIEPYYSGVGLLEFDDFSLCHF